MEHCKHEHTYDYEDEDHNNPNAVVIIQARCIHCDKLISQRIKSPDVKKGQSDEG